MRSLVKILVMPICLVLVQAGSAQAERESTYVKATYSLPLTLDPTQMNDTASLQAGNLIYDGLLRFSSSLKIESALAEKWSTSSDGKTLTFHLKPNAKFHDGRKISANDVVVSLARTLAPHSKVRKFYDCIEGADEKNGTFDHNKLGIKALNSSTVQIRLKHPFPPFLSVLAGATAKILPADQVNSLKFFEAPIGSGAFRFHSKNPKQKTIKLSAFKEYYRGEVQIAHLVLKETNEAEAIKLAQNNQVHDLASWPLTANDKVFESGQRVTAPVAATWIIGLNTTKAPFDRVEVRRSFKKAIDSELFRKAFYPDAIPAHGYIPNGLPGAQTSAIFENVPKKVSSEKITIVIPEELSRHAEMKSLLEAQLKAQGWKAEVVSIPWDRLMDGYAQKSHQAFLVSMNMDYPDAEFLLRNFESSNPDNFSGLKNEKLDHALKNARTLRDRKERERFYREAIGLVADSAVTVNLFHPKANYWVSKCVQGFEPNLLADVYVDYTKVRLDPSCESKVAMSE